MSGPLVKIVTVSTPFAPQLKAIVHLGRRMGTS